MAIKRVWHGSATPDNADAYETLLQRAYEDPGVTHVLVETLPDLAPSIGVLEKTGFVITGEGSEPGVVRYEHRRKESL